MANSGKVLQVRLQEKIDTLANWLALDTDTTPFIPLAGEKINVKVPTINSEADGESVGYEIITKTGDDSTRFKDLPWDSALAADVYDWAKASVKPSYTYSEIGETPTLVNLTIKANDNDTNALTFDPDGSAKTLIVDGSNGIKVNGSSNKLTIEGQTATSSEKGMVLSGGNITVATNGAVTVNDSAHATNASTADNATRATTAGTADKVANSLVIKGAGTAVETYDGSIAGEVNLVAGSNVTITPDADTNTITIASSYTNTDTKVQQNAAINTAGEYPVILAYSTATTKVTNAVNKASDLTYNPSTNILSAPTFKGNLQGNADTATSATSATTAGTADKTKATLTLKAGTNSKTFNGSEATTFEVTAADLGISAPLDFIGTTTTALTDGATTTPIKVNSEDHTAVKGDVVLYGDKEFLWTGSAWEELGDASALADAVADLNGVIDGLKLTQGNGITLTGSSIKSGYTITHADTSSQATVSEASKITGITLDTFGHVTKIATGTDADTKVTSVENHYTPATDTDFNLNAEANSTTAATWGTTDMVTGVHLQRDAAGHVTGMTVDSIQMPANPNTDKTKVTAGIGLAGGGTANSSSGVTVKAKLRSEDALTIDSAAATTTTGRVYPVATDKSGYLAVNVPWVNTTYSAATTAAAGLMSAADKIKLNGIATGANNYSLASSGAYTDSNATYTFTLTPTINGTAETAMSLKVPTMVGATSSAASKAGLVPLCTAANRTKFLRGDGTWVTPTNTTYSDFTTTAKGLVNPASTATVVDGKNDILFNDHTWHGADDYIVLCAGTASINI